MTGRILPDCHTVGRSNGENARVVYMFYCCHRKCDEVVCVEGGVDECNMGDAIDLIAGAGWKWYGKSNEGLATACPEHAHLMKKEGWDDGN